MTGASLLAGLTPVFNRLGPWLLGGLAIVLLLILLWRRWGNVFKKVKKTASPAQASAPAPGPGRKELLKLWRDFCNRLPWEVRRYLGDLPIFVLMGEAGSGKTRLVNTCTDWQRQSDQLRPSHMTSPLLQFYLGSRAVVLEMSAGLLADTSLAVCRALDQLLRALPQARPPHVVLSLNAATLTSRDPESLRRLAGAMRGKINLLAKATGQSVYINLALTHLDHMPGYSQWVAFLETQGLALQASWNWQDLAAKTETKNPRPALTEALDRYEVLLPRALTMVSAHDFLVMVRFLKEAEEWLALADHFARLLQASDAFSPSPQLVRLSLHGQEEGISQAQPFQAEARQKTRRSWSPLRKHQLAAASLLAIGTLVLTGLFMHQHNVLWQLDGQIDKLETARPTNYNDLHQLFPVPTRRPLGEILLPAFFPEAEQILLSRLSRAIRHHYLFPELRRLQAFGDASEQLVYLLGLIHATPRNGLSDMILAEPRDWAVPLNLPLQLVIDYARHNHDRPEKPINANMLRSGKESLWDPLKERMQWTFLLGRLEQVNKEPFLTPEVLRELQANSAPLLQMARRIFAYPRFNDIVATLKQIDPFAFNSDTGWLQRREELAQQRQLIELVRSVGTASLDFPEVRDLSLASFLKLLSSMPNAIESEQAPFTLSVGERSFTVSLKDWQDLIIRSQITLMIRNFISANQHNRGFIFFDSTSEFPDIWLNAGNDGSLFFVGQAKIDGRLSRDAFDKRVKPVVESLDEQLQALPVAKGERARFREAVGRHVGWYADRYADAYRRYWMQFRINVDSEASLRFALNQILDFSSPFFDFLLAVQTNTALETGDNPLFRPLSRRLEMFRFVHQIMQQKDGVYPEWEKYKGFVSQMRDDLDRDKPAMAGPGGKNDTAAFLDVLTPLGRISYAMQIEDPASHLSFCRMWLKSTGIGPEWQAPFLDPFRAAHALGKGEIEESIAFVWEDLNNEYIEALRTLFPFQATAQEAPEPKELERILGPQGGFWQSFRLYLAPVCKETDGVWLERVTGQGVIALPRGMLADVNALARLTSALWDAKGAPKALLYRLQPAPLPGGMRPDQVPVFSYLRLGDASIMAFNQQPSWQELKVEWWKAEPAGVGIALESPDSRRKNHRELSVDRGYWSLYRLLTMGRSVDTKTMTWSLDSPTGEAMLLEYIFMTDPWELFRLPDAGLNLSGKPADMKEEPPL